VLETGEYTSLDHSRGRTSDVRVIFATNRMPSEMVKNGLMREDFYYRISMIPINLPPLRERKEDIPLLVDHFLTQYSEDEKKPVLTGKIMDILYNYEWPGNVRELLSVIRRYLVLGDFPILDMGEKTDNLELGIDNDFGEGIDGLAMAMDIQEKRFILKALSQYRCTKEKPRMP
jgi:transcriptional regulator with PAS, ATPase and Fis domain